MSEHSNKLSPAEAERLALLLEECGEVQQAIGKILRHGYESMHPIGQVETNREALERELGDVEAAIDIMVSAGDISDVAIEKSKDQKLMRVGRYLHHNVVPS